MTAIALRQPTLRHGVSIIATTSRGETWYIVRNPESGSYLRMGQAEGRVLRAVDGVTSAAGISQRLTNDGFPIAAATVEAFLRTCSRRGLLERTASESSILQLERLRAERSRRRSIFRGELMRMRWSFGDPDALLDRTMPFLRWVFTRGFVVASIVMWLTAVLVATGQSARFHTEVASMFVAANFTFATAALLWFTIFFISLVHELGHAYTCKYYGGQVHELGFMLMYFEPAFYCNVNDAWSFPELSSRLWVTTAGGWIELVLAAAAIIVWGAAQPGTAIASFALLVALLAGGWSILANVNPLLPTDGYFALSDALGIPNLRQRGLGHWGWWIRRHVMGLDVPEPPTSPDERRILLRYGALASIYIAFTLGLVLYLVGGWVGGRLGGFGLVLLTVVALLTLRSMLRGWGRTIRDSIGKHAGAMAESMRGRRARRAAIAAAIIVAAAFIIPWPLTSRGHVRAVNASPATAIVSADSGLVSAVLVREGQHVTAGEPVLVLADPELMRERESHTRAVAAQSAAAVAARAHDDAAGEQIAAAQEDAAQALASATDERIARQVVRARADGVVATQHPEQLVGRMLSPGEIALNLADPDSVELHIDMSDVGAVAVRPGMRVRLISYIDPAHPIVTRVSSVAASGDTSQAVGATTAGRVEARVRMARSTAWRPGATGEASVILRNSSISMAIWRWMHSAIRTDLWL